MGECRICGEESRHPYTCNYCGGTHCSNHRLPENHHCSGASSVKTLGPELRDGFGSGIREKISGRSSGPETAEVCHTAGNTPSDDDLGDSSPDVALDGSIKDREGSRNATDDGRDLLPLLLAPFYFVAGIVSTVATQIWRTVRAAASLFWSPYLLIFVLVTGGMLVGAEAGYLDSGPDSPVGSSTSGSDDVVNPSVVEDQVHEKINEERRERGLAPIESDTELQMIAREHSRDMATRDYFSHTSPEGETFEDRYEAHGYTCEVSRGDGSYATGGENIAQTYYDRRVETPDGDVETYTTEEELATAIVEQWMNSDGHRKNILREYWANEGIGVHITDDGEVFVTQNFCQFV